MRYGLTLLVPPSAEPITLEEAKLWCRVENDRENDLILRWIEEARQECESETERSLLTQTWRLTLDCFPGGYPRSVEWGEWSDWMAQGPIRLPRAAPLQSVTSVKYLDGNGTQQTLSAALYKVLADREPAIIVPAYSQVWPVTRLEKGAVEVIYIAGALAVADVPEALRSAILMRLQWRYQRRPPTDAELQALRLLMSHHDVAEYV